ncbi:hypothetical protein DD589_30945 [Klebsiella pneumoniae]|nr:hypothetical protein DD589_30945 [Klebsiella pneumoniae]
MPPSGTTAGTASDVDRLAALRWGGPTLFNLWGTGKPDKACMPQFGTTASTVSDEYHPASLT